MMVDEIVRIILLYDTYGRFLKSDKLIELWSKNQVYKLLQQHRKIYDNL